MAGENLIPETHSPQIAASPKFDSTIQPLLAYANPDQFIWSGDAAESYTDANQSLMSPVGRTAAADAATAGTVKLQADQVQQLRNELAETKLTLIGLLVLIMTFLGPLNFAAAKANTFPLPSEMADDFDPSTYQTPAWSRSVEGITRVTEPWLPFIVLPPCISATIAADVLFGLLIADGDSNANDIEDQTKEYQDVADQADKIRAGTSPAPAVGVPTAPISHAPSVADASLAPGTSATAKAAATPMSNTRSFADTFLTPHPSTTAARAPTPPATPTPATVQEPAITVDADDVATSASYADYADYADGIPIEAAAGRTPTQPTLRQDRS